MNSSESELTRILLVQEGFVIVNILIALQDFIVRLRQDQEAVFTAFQPGKDFRRRNRFGFINIVDRFLCIGKRGTINPKSNI